MISFRFHEIMKHKKRLLFLVIILVLIAAGGVSFLLSVYGLSVSRYSVSVPAFTQSIRIVQLTDLHNSVFEPHNSRLVQKVAAQKPDLILITGDLLNNNEERTDIAEELITQLADIAPVYVSFGNHETGYEKKYRSDLRDLYTEAGATVLERDWADLTVKGQRLRLGGIYGYCLPANLLSTGEARADECEFLESFQDTELYKILMCHMPYCWIVSGSLNYWDVDCVLCGHVHGGQVRIPFIGGLWAPDQGWFPGRESGLYSSEDGSRVMVLSRGLGNTDQLPRFNNIPEILVLDLLPGE